MRKANIIITALVILGISTIVFGQSTPKASVASGMKSGASAGSYALDGFDSINYQNGSLNFSLPLVTIGGRGEASFTMMYTIENRWNVDVQKELVNCGPSNLCNYQSIYYPTRYEPFNSKAGLTPGILWATHTGRYAQTNCQGTNAAFAHRLTTVTFAMPGGSSVTFYDQINDGKVMAGGACGATNGPTRGNVFVSRDGSGMTFISDTNLEDKWIAERENPSGTVFTKTGVKYRIDTGFVTGITDRQGNTITFTYSNGPENYTATDSLGRQIQLTTVVSNFYAEQFITSKGSNGVTRTIKIGKSGINGLRSDYPGDLTYSQAFPELNGAQRYSGLIREGEGNQVELPNGRKYRFFYNQYGDLARVELPTGGAYEYDWESGFNNSGSGAFSSGSNGTVGFIYRSVVEKRTYDNGGSGVNYTSKTNISKAIYDSWTTPIRVREYMGDNATPISRTDHYYYGDVFYGMMVSEPFYPESWESGKEYKTEVFSGDGTQLLRRNEQLWQARTFTTWSWGTTQGKDPRVIENKTTLADTNQIAVTTAIHPTTGAVSFDQYNNQTDVYEYDYGVGQRGDLKRHTHTDFVTDTNYINNYLRSLPSQTWISSDADGQNIVSKSQIEYDNYLTDSLFPRTNVIGHDTANYGTTKTIRGNATKVTTYSDVNNTNTAIETKTQYDILGNIVKITDGRNNSSDIYYTDRFGSPDGEAQSNTAPTQLNGQNTFAFPTSGKNNMGWIIGYTQYDYFTGQPVNTEDINGVISKTIYNDLLDRPTQTVSAIGTPYEMQSNIIYDDANKRIESKSDLFALNDNLSKSESFYDGLGRTFESRKYESDGGYIASKTEFDALGRAKRASNPYRPLKGETAVWTENFYDSLSRVIKVKTPDGAEATTSYSGNVTTVTDQALKKRRSVTNALGQLIRIDEPNDAGQLDVSNVPVQSTNYSYNTLGNLVKVSQGTQNRFFKYDSLGRLIRLRQPEQGTNSNLALTDTITGNNDWSIGSTYDANGNVLTTTDAKGVVTTHTYDALNRPLTRTYNDGTPAVTNTYDAVGVPYSKGQLTEISNSVSTTKITQFDTLGKSLVNQQITEGNTYTSSYQYNLIGDLVQETYPSGRVVRNDYNSNNEISKIYGQKNASSVMRTYANNISYTAWGAIDKIKLGNGRFESAKFNNRLQVTELAVGSSVGDGSLWKLNYEFGELQTNNSVDTSKNSGNIAKQTINFNGLANPIYQGYKYDSLNRVTEAKETANSQTTWQQNFGYDRFGNRTSFNQVVNGNQMAINNITLPSVDAGTNRISSSGYVYDANGNLINDPQNRQFTFNGDNKQTVVRDLNIPTTTQNPDANVIGKYFYDGSGKRIKKVTNTETTIFVYSGSKLIAEYSTKLSDNPTTSYTATDMLGSPRVITDANGQVVSRRDFMAFGEEIAANVGGRTTTNKYGQSDSVRQRFTSYQKDDETGLDFAEARYYNGNHGRFTAVDPLLASGKGANPQTFNRYVYAMNRPLVLTDPTGMQVATKPDNPESVENKKKRTFSVTVEDKVVPVVKPPESLAIQTIWVAVTSYNKENGPFPNPALPSTTRWDFTDPSVQDDYNDLEEELYALHYFLKKLDYLNSTSKDVSEVAVTKNGEVSVGGGASITTGTSRSTTYTFVPFNKVKAAVNERILTLREKYIEKLQGAEYTQGRHFGTSKVDFTLATKFAKMANSRVKSQATRVFAKVSQ
jgi:RHS repeat-associated protein